LGDITHLLSREVSIRTALERSTWVSAKSLFVNY